MAYALTGFRREAQRHLDGEGVLTRAAKLGHVRARIAYTEARLCRAGKASSTARWFDCLG